MRSLRLVNIDFSTPAHGEQFLQSLYGRGLQFLQVELGQCGYQWHRRHDREALALAAASSTSVTILVGHLPHLHNCATSLGISISVDAFAPCGGVLLEALETGARPAAPRFEMLRPRPALSGRSRGRASLTRGPSIVTSQHVSWTTRGSPSSLKRRRGPCMRGSASSCSS